MADVRIFIGPNAKARFAKLHQVPVKGDYVQGEGGMHEVLKVLYTPDRQTVADILVGSDSHPELG